MATQEPRGGGGQDRPAERESITKVVGASVIGTSLEWYDFFLYGSAAALVFPQLFFPSSDPLAGTLLSFGTFAVGFVARPIGAVVFGHFGDRLGRKRMLALTLLHHGRRDLPHRLLPGYATLGVLAPILLVVLRFVQGLGLGGEWGGAVLMATEHGHRGPPRPLRRLGAVRRAGRQPALDRPARALRRDPLGRGLPRLRLAHAVPAERGPGGGGPVHPPEDRRVAALRGGRGDARPVRACRSSTC